MNFKEWRELNSTWIEIKFLNSLSGDEVPLDDDTPDFLDDHAEEFEDFARKLYKNKEL